MYEGHEREASLWQGRGYEEVTVREKRPSGLSPLLQRGQRCSSGQRAVWAGGGH